MSFDIETLKKKELLNIEEAMFYLDIRSKETIYGLVSSGKIKSFKDGNRRRFLRSSLDEYIDSYIEDPAI